MTVKLKHIRNVKLYFLMLIAIQRHSALRRMCTHLITALLAFVWLLTGCAREEKTLLLPQSQPAEEETESTSPAKDFSVKKIFAYTYETSYCLEKSAFLQGCEENEVHIAALEEKNADESLVYRKVDYRYGFYDTMDVFFETWEDYFNPTSGETEWEELYIDQLLPSPNGTQMLVYARSESWNTGFIWLYTLGEKEPLLLYEGASESSYRLKGSFSPSGRWVTFDIGAVVMSPKDLVPIYDCEKEASREDVEYWSVLTKNATTDRFYPPDELLYNNANDSEWLWSAALWELSGKDTPCLASFLLEKDGRLVLQAELKVADTPDTEGEPAGQQGRGKGRLYLLGTDGEESNTSKAATQASQISPPLDSSTDYSQLQQHMGFYLEGFIGTPLFQYQFAEQENRLYYMGSPYQLFSLWMDSAESAGNSFSFPEAVWDFLPLESGDLLVALITDPSAIPYEASPVNGWGDSVMTDGSASPRTLQFHWDIQSADLYLYPADGSDPVLLYKNVQNLLHMEYDAEHGRILLETYEDGMLSHRRCIILEL